MITVGWLIVLIIGGIGVVKAHEKSEYANSSTAWFLTAFWVYLVFAPFVAFGVHVLAGT